MDSVKIYKLAESMTDAEYEKKYSKLTEKQKLSVQSLIRLGDMPKLALATTLLNKDNDSENSDTWNLYKYAKGSTVEGGGIDTELKEALGIADGGGVFTQDFFDKYELVKETYSTKKNPNADELAKNRKKELQQQGFLVKMKKVSFEDLARSVGYFIIAVKRKNETFAKGSTIGKNRYKVAFYLTQSDDTLQSAIISAEDEKEAKYKVADLVKDLYGDYLDYEVTEVVKYAKGSTLPTFEKLPKNRQANKKYKYFAVGKDDGKIVNGWEIVSDLESLKYYAKGDLKDMDLKPSDFKIISKERLMRSGINPFDYDNWRKIDFSNDMPYIPKAKKGTNIKGKKSNSGIKIESYLPIFNGFYNTLFEANEEMYIEDPYDYDDYEFNYKQYHLDVAKECVGAIEQELNYLSLGISIKFQALDSPREYNFRNDRIDVEYTLGADSLNKIHSYLLENKDAFSEYVKENYTSRSGFYSFHSNDVNEWLDNIKNGTDLDHKLGAVLNFILQNENYTDSDLYDRIIGNVYLEADLKESSKGKEYAEGGVIPNQKTDTNFNSYTAVGYAEGFIEAPSMEAQIEAWAYLIATKQAYSLQGWFGRQAESLIGNGIIARDGTINWDKVYDMSDEQFANGGNTSSGFGYSIGGL
jgi:hypothetical protein